MKIIDKQNRAVLGEGRTAGVGFAFLKRLKPKEYETVMPLSPCKDYLNDAVYGEHLNVSVGACGLKYTPQQIFNTKKRYLAIKVLKNNRSDGYSLPNRTFEGDKKKLAENYKNIEGLLNWIEERLEISKTKIYAANDDMFTVVFDPYWTETTYGISLYTLILRMAIDYDGSVPPHEFLNSYNQAHEISLWNQARQRLFFMLKGIKLEQKFDPKTGGGIHSHGILFWQPPVKFER